MKKSAIKTITRSCLPISPPLNEPILTADSHKVWQLCYNITTRKQLREPRRSPPLARAPKLCLSADGAPLSPPQAPCCWANAPTESRRAELGWALSDLTLEQPGSAEEEEREEVREREEEEEEEEEEKEGETAGGLSKCTQEPR
ncbi:hypothetical protein MHYP_G00201380 [Metynnis hypsauchen]